jgi:hypothetical protein
LVTQGRACLRWLAHEPPNLGEGRRSVEAMIDSGVRAAEVISRLRAMMTKSPPHRDLLNINDAILAVIALVGAEAQRNRVYCGPSYRVSCRWFWEIGSSCSRLSSI